MTKEEFDKHIEAERIKRQTRAIPPAPHEAHVEAHARAIAATQDRLTRKRTHQHSRGQHPDHCGVCRAHTVVDEVTSGARPHEHKVAEHPETCGICRAQQVAAEEI